MTAVDPYDGIDFGPPGDDPEAPIPIRRARSKGPLRTRLLTVSQLADLPDPSPLIRGTIDLGTVTVLAGYWGTLKSFVALDWAWSVATGRRWLGRPCEQRRVLYVAGEGAYGIHARLDAWQTGWQTRVPDDAFALVRDPVHLLNTTDVLELCGLVDEDDYGLVIIDTVSKSIPGADENSAKDMSGVVGALYEIQAHTHGGTVVAVHHTGKDKSTIRGSSALEAGVDTVYLTEGDTEALTLTRTKRKDGPREDVLNLRFAPVPGTRSGVIESRIDLGNGPSAEALLSHVRSHFSATGATKREIVDTSGMASSTAYRAINDLLTSGALVNRGTDARPRYYPEEP